MKMTRITFIIWTFLFAVIYTIWGSGAAAVIVILSVIYFIVALLSVTRGRKKLRLSLEGGGFSEKGGTLPISLKISNGSRLPLAACRVNLRCENLLTGEAQNKHITFSLKPKGKSEIRVDLTDARCGREVIDAGEATLSDGLGIFRGAISGIAHGEVAFLPTIEKMDIPGEYLDSYDMDSYVYSQHQKGTDQGEVFGIREYRDGDSQKAIHWKLSAKMDQVMVRIPSYPIENNIVLILDNSTETDLDPDRRSRLMDMFFSFSFSLLEDGVSHTLGWYDVPAGKFEMKAVADQNDMWEAMAVALGAGFDRSGVSTVYRFIEALEDEVFTNHFLVTAGEERDIDKLENYGAVRIFRSR